MMIAIISVILAPEWTWTAYGLIRNVKIILSKYILTSTPLSHGPVDVMKHRQGPVARRCTASARGVLLSIAILLNNNFW